MKFAFIQAKDAEFPIQAMCDVLSVSRSGYYKWRARKQPKRAAADERLLGEIKSVRQGKQRWYGSPRVFHELKAKGHAVSRKRVERVMREFGISKKRAPAFRATTDSAHNHMVASNLLKRNFTASAPNRVWVADVTYLATNEGWLYLAVVLDIFSRRAVGWSLHSLNDADLTTAALRNAVAVRRPGLDLIFHSDRGSNYACDAHRYALASIGARASMSRKGDCWDNAVAESFFASLRKELTNHERFLTREHARQSVKEYIDDFYNLTRRHSTIGYLSPIEFELRMAASAA